MLTIETLLHDLEKSLNSQYWRDGWRYPRVDNNTVRFAIRTIRDLQMQVVDLKREVEAWQENYGSVAVELEALKTKPTKCPKCGDTEIGPWLCELNNICEQCYQNEKTKKA